MPDIISELLAQYHSQLDTRAILIDHDVFTKCYEPLKENLTAGTWLVAVDENTWEVAGKFLAQELDAQNQPWEKYVVECPPSNQLNHGDIPGCDDETIAAFEQAIQITGCTAAIAVGSGTINDIVKLASFRQSIPMAVVATAPSMNGYTSGIAAVLSESVKTTVPCKAPSVIIADIDVMAEAPYRMICSGLGDLMSKPVSNADWQLSAMLNGSFHSSDAMAIIEAGAALLEGIAPKLPGRDRDAVKKLTESLMLSGLAMSVAGSSSPASGGEHLISHYIDMTAHTFDLPNDFHGCQVGVGTLTTAYIYEKFFALSPADINIDQCLQNHKSWDGYSIELRQHFGPLYPAVEKHAFPAYPAKEQLRSRLETLINNWEPIKNSVSKTLRTKNSLEEELLAAQCPVKFSELNVDRKRAYHAVVYGKDIRNRYTILHLAAELGLLTQWADEALGELY